jgi:hypothetical protein
MRNTTRLSETMTIDLRGEPPPEDVFEAKVFDLMTLANYLLVDIVKEPCNELILKVQTSTDPIKLYFFANEFFSVFRW